LAVDFNASSLRKAFPNALDEYIDAFVALKSELQNARILDNEKRFKHFFTQGAAETGGFTIKEESGNYSAERLRAVFPKYFASVAAAKPYARNARAIFNRVYGKRLGNTGQDDGYNYRGRGIFQATGKANYKTYGERLGLDLVANPNLAADPMVSIRMAILYWSDLKLNDWADKDDLLAVSRGINGGSPTRNIQPNGMSDRRTWYARISKSDLMSAPSEPVKAAPDEFREGDTGTKVTSLQTRLRAKGYPVGAIDGIYGAATRRAVTMFQHEMALSEFDGVWRPDYDALLTNAPSLAVERKEVTAKDLETQGDTKVKQLNWLQRLLMFLGFGSLLTGTAADQASNFPALVTQYKPVLEIFGPSLQWVAQNGWLLIGIACIAGFLLARSVLGGLVKAYRNNDYQGPFKGAE
jgi:putative chitinase